MPLPQRKANVGDQLFVNPEPVYTFARAGEFLIGLPGGDDLPVRVGAGPRSNAPALPQRTAKVGHKLFVGADPVHTFDSPGSFVVGLPGGGDLPLKIESEIVVGPTPTPDGFKLANGGNLHNAVDGNATVLVERGNVYRGRVNIRKDNRRIIAWGDPAKPLPVLKGEIESSGRKGIALEGVDQDGTGIAKPGLLAFHCDDIRLTDCRIRNFDNFGLLIVGEDGNPTTTVLFDRLLIQNNSGPGGKESGFHFVHVNNAVVRASVIDQNGWRPGKHGSDIFSHGGYTHGTSGPVVYEDCIFSNNSSHGLQARSGGFVRRCLFMDNPIHLDFGFVNGDVVFPGGVSGEVAGNVFIGTRDISSGPAAGPRGWAMQLGNNKSVAVNDNLIEGNLKVIVAKCSDVKGSARDVGIQSLTMDRNFGGKLEVSGFGDQVNANLRNAYAGKVGLPLNVNLRNALSADYMKRYRANPATAARDGVARCRAAAQIP